jgi:hypothetical protein
VGTRQEARVEQRITSVDLAGIVEILRVGAGGIPTWIKIKVTDHRAMIGLPDGTTEAVPPGDTITGAWNGKRFEVTSEPGRLSRGAAALLSQVLSTVKHEGSPGATDDDVFGTAARQRVGATWAFDKKVVAADLRRLGIAVDPGKIVGVSKLVSFAKVKGEPCLKIESNIRADKFEALSAARGNLPPGLKLVQGSLHVAVTSTVPVIPFKRPVAAGETIKISMMLEGEVGVRKEPVQIIRVIRGSRQEELTELPAESVVETK